MNPSQSHVGSLAKTSSSYKRLGIHMYGRRQLFTWGFKTCHLDREQQFTLAVMADHSCKAPLLLFISHSLFAFASQTKPQSNKSILMTKWT